MAIDAARLARGALIALALAATACAAPAAEKTAGHPPTRASAAATPAHRPPVTRADSAIALANPGFESDRTGPDGGPEGWYSYQHAGETSYLFVLDAAVRHDGTRSMRIDNVGSQPYGSIAQQIDVKGLGGKTVRFSAWLRTAGADGDGMALFVIAEGAGILAHDFMAGREVKGTREWARYAVTLPLPKATTQLRVGATFQGKGSAWLDDAVLEIVAAP